MITQYAVNQFLQQVIDYLLVVGCPGVALVSWFALAWAYHRRRERMLNQLIPFVFALTLSAVVVLAATWYRGLPTGQ